MAIMQTLKTVTVLSTKWNGDLHRRTSMIELGSDASGTWLWMPDRTVVATKSGSFTAVPGLRLFPAEEMWSAYFVPAMPDQERHGYVYVDITTVASRRDELIQFVDLDLDVEVFEGAAVRVLDRDEFEENAAAWCYPDDLVAAAEQTCAEVEAAMTRRDPPFDGSHQNWLARAAAWDGSGS